MERALDCMSNALTITPECSHTWYSHWKQMQPHMVFTLETNAATHGIHTGKWKQRCYH